MNDENMKLIQRSFSASIRRAEEETAREAWEAASARMSLARIRSAAATLLDRAEPIGMSGIDREKLGDIIRYIIYTQDLEALTRQLKERK